MKLVTKCRAERGIIVMQPEHVLSLKLACVMSLHEDGTRTHSTPILQKRSRGLQRILHVLTGSLMKSVSMLTILRTVLH